MHHNVVLFDLHGQVWSTWLVNNNRTTALTVDSHICDCVTASNGNQTVDFFLKECMHKYNFDWKKIDIVYVMYISFISPRSSIIQLHLVLT